MENSEPPTKPSTKQPQRRVRPLREGYASHSSDLMFTALGMLLMVVLAPFACNAVFSTMRTLCMSPRGFTPLREALCESVHPQALFDAVLPAGWRGYTTPLSMCANVVHNFEVSVCGGGGICSGVSTLLGIWLWPLSCALWWSTLVHPSKWTRSICLAVSMTIVSLVVLVELSPRLTTGGATSSYSGNHHVTKLWYLSDWVELVANGVYKVVEEVALGSTPRRASSFSGATVDAPVTVAQLPWDRFIMMDHVSFFFVVLTAVNMLRRVWGKPDAFYRSVVLQERYEYYGHGLTFLEALGNTFYYAFYVFALAWFLLVICLDGVRASDPWFQSITVSSRDFWQKEVVSEFRKVWELLKDAME